MPSTSWSLTREKRYFERVEVDSSLGKVQKGPEGTIGKS